jgi:LacI family transcriptional regulator
VCQGRGYTVILCNSENLPALHRKQVDLLRRRRVDGIVFGSVLLDDPETEALIASGYPCIQYNRRLRSGRGSYIVADNVRAGMDATAHLIGLGHRRIGFIAGTPEASTAHQRLAGYRAALQASGIEVDEELIRDGRYQSQAARRAAEELLKRQRPPTAVIGSSDAMALSILQAAGELGVRVPEELAVAGIDDIEVSAHYNLQLTTVSQHAAEMAGLAATWMLEIAQDPARFAREPFQYVIRPTLIIRRTCGAVR